MSLHTCIRTYRRAWLGPIVALLGLPAASVANDLKVPTQYATIQQAVDAAQPGDRVMVAKGTFRGPGNVNINTYGKAVTIQGTGYLSTVIDCEGYARAFMFNNGEGSSTIVRSLAIRGGNQITGGAMAIINSSPAIIRCSIEDSSATYGGAIAINQGSPGFISTRFKTNRAEIAGGAIYSVSSSPTISGCTFDSNETKGAGGGISMQGGSLYIISSIFKDNDADQGGGAFASSGGDAMFINGSFSVNTANVNGGAIDLGAGTTASLTNCTLAANISRQGPGALRVDSQAVATVANTIMWSDGKSEFSGPVAFRYSCVTGGVPGPGNTADNPRLVDAIGHDLHVQLGSSSIDKADKNSVSAGEDQDGRSRVIGSAPDMGAYEYPIVRPVPVANTGADNVFAVPHDGDPNTSTTTIKVKGRGYDWLLGQLSFTWLKEDEVVGTQEDLQMEAEAGDLEFKLKVRDPDGGVTKDTIVVKVLPEANSKPVANAGADQAIILNASVTAPVTLSGHGYDSDGDPVSYRWSNGATTPQITLNLPAGTHRYSLTVTDPYGASSNDEVTIKVLDGVPPTVLLVGSANLALEVFTPWVDPGATANDALDGQLAVRVYGLVNPNKLGTYTITYAATDNSGNVGSTKRTVKVQDTTPPVITISGQQNMQLECASGYTEPGATATDNYDGVVPVTITGTVLSAKGTYSVTYKAKDSSNNVATVVRTVTVKDNTPPVITLNGANPMNVDCKKGYTEPGATAFDSCDGNLPVTITGTVVMTRGTYFVNYKATDSSGNSTTVVRTVIVSSKTPPSANNFNSTPSNIQANNKMRDINLHYGFNSHCASFTWNVTCTANQSVAAGDIVKIDNNNFSVKGVTGRIYTFTLTATDADGNTATYTTTLPCN